ncbi:MAG: SMC-Scp complex subunit ScpB [Actinomycetaceae bacterium]|nr:SMC-Scp complex subunit ScpB [Actinomycetaceae bacterium]
MKEQPTLHAELMMTIEAVLIIADHPITAEQLAPIVGAQADTVLDHLNYLRDEYNGYYTGLRPRGFELREAGGGWRIYSSPRCIDVVEKYVSAPRVAKLSQAAIETLAIIAYKQPITRSAIGHIRGVNVDGVVKSLSAKGLIECVDTDESTGAAYWATTQGFLEYMGIDTLDDLPPLAPHLPPDSDLDTIEDEIIERHFQVKDQTDE